MLVLWPACLTHLLDGVINPFVHLLQILHMRFIFFHRFFDQWLQHWMIDAMEMVQMELGHLVTVMTVSLDQIFDLGLLVVVELLLPFFVFLRSKGRHVFEITVQSVVELIKLFWVLLFPSDLVLTTHFDSFLNAHVGPSSTAFLFRGVLGPWLFGWIPRAVPMLLHEHHVHTMRCHALRLRLSLFSFFSCLLKSLRPISFLFSSLLGSLLLLLNFLFGQDLLNRW